MAKILVVDDSATARGQLRVALEKASHSVSEASNGFEAKNLVQNASDFDLILCDLNMPEMDGMTFCRKIRSNPNLSGLRIFMCTAEPSPEIKAEAKGMGVSVWITKPFDPSKLAAAISKFVAA